MDERVEVLLNTKEMSLEPLDLLGDAATIIVRMTLCCYVHLPLWILYPVGFFMWLPYPRWDSFLVMVITSLAERWVHDKRRTICCAVHLPLWILYTIGFFMWSLYPRWELFLVLVATFVAERWGHDERRTVVVVPTEFL